MIEDTSSFVAFVLFARQAKDLGDMSSAQPAMMSVDSIPVSIRPISAILSENVNLFGFWRFRGA
jgi:hypothetical protein